MTMITIEHEHGTATVDVKNIYDVSKIHNHRGMLGEFYPLIFIFSEKTSETKNEYTRYKLTEEQYNSLVQKLTSCS
jgi:uncharacterized protein Veg